jgi:hypothetical protein
MLGCAPSDARLEKGATAYAKETSIPVYRLYVPLTLAELENSKMDVVKKKQLREHLDRRFPIMVQGFTINEEQFYKNGSSLLGIVVQDTLASIPNIRYESKEKYFELNFKKAIKLGTASEATVFERDAFKMVPGKLYVRANDVTNVSSEKYK